MAMGSLIQKAMRLSEPPSLKDAGAIAMSSSCASTIRLLDISVQGGESRLDARLG